MDRPLGQLAVGVLTMTYTYALLEVSPEAYDEIRKKLEAAGYQHAFGADGEIDMHGIALTRETGSPRQDEDPV